MICVALHASVCIFDVSFKIVQAYEYFWSEFLKANG